VTSLFTLQAKLEPRYRPSCSSSSGGGEWAHQSVSGRCWTRMNWASTDRFIARHSSHLFVMAGTFLQHYRYIAQ